MCCPYKLWHVWTRLYFKIDYNLSKEKYINCTIETWLLIHVMIPIFEIYGYL